MPIRLITLSTLLILGSQTSTASLIPEQVSNPSHCTPAISHALYAPSVNPQADFVYRLYTAERFHF
ncbi:hypothetical protein VRRI112168_00075 [Vreelandella rituensis]|uniref:Uncharacterized protein n=1 Tax=Vreelandella rituensis TaxID=2282306 RepID=A0A368UA53_9GAMM|nr:hypothetical protein [Halomonas rituensis]RCV93905.1 hypothetical protein DU506_01730 [Halomonas rituensis]